MLEYKNAMFTPLVFKESEEKEEEEYETVEYDFKYVSKELRPLALVVRQEFLKLIWDKVQKFVSSDNNIDDLVS